MRKLALATCQELPTLWAGDRLFLDELVRRGYDAAPVVWDDPAIDWRAWDAVIIRSCWDYHLKIGRFFEWLDAVSTRPVINRADLVKWNAHKRYLFDIARAGGRIPRTAIVEQGREGTLSDHLGRSGWEHAVIKPAISATGYKTRLIRWKPTPEDERAFAEASAVGDVLVQEYVPEVSERGEWSLMFFDGRYSHAALKRAAPGEFRVHIEWGGTVERAAPPPALVVQAQALIDALALGATYARVDGTEVNGDLMIMELEVIEPELFFDMEPAAPAQLADAVERVLESPK